MGKTVIDRLIGYFSPEAAFKRDQARLRSMRIDQAKAKFDAAGQGRRNASWNAADTSANAEIAPAIVFLRARSRDLVRNNPYAAKAVETIVSNTVGSGIVPSAKAPNKRRQDLANQLMAEWMADCDLHGRIDLYAMQSLLMRAETEGGEALILRRMGNRGASRIPLKLAVREGDYLDHLKTIDEMVDGGGYIRQGVQFSPSGRIAGYWVFDTHPGDRTGFQQLSSRFIQADQVAHVFEMRRPEQCRGIPRGVAGFQKMRNLDDFQDARLEQMKVAACMVGLITDLDGDSQGDALPEKLEPGMFPQLPGGKDVRFNNPPSVSGHAEFTTLEQKAIASAYGITYEALTGDLSGVNFSSAKMGWIEFSRNIDRWRWNLIIPAMKRVERWFLDAAEMAGYDMTGVSFEWTPPRREMIDPTKEIPAQIKAIRAGLKSWQETARENGYDPQLLLKEIAEDNRSFDAEEISLDSDPRRTTIGGQTQMEPAPAQVTEEE